MSWRTCSYGGEASEGAGGYKHLVPVVPHKAVAEVSRIGNYRRDWLL